MPPAWRRREPLQQCEAMALDARALTPQLVGDTLGALLKYQDDISKMQGDALQKVLKETPVPKGTEVLVRVTRSGVCHSDLHIWEGYFELGGGKRFYVKERGCVPPFTLGHEPFGVVEAFGPKAKGVKVGQKRIVYPWIGCGHCPICASGEEHLCNAPKALGVNVDGGYEMN